MCIDQKLITYTIYLKCRRILKNIFNEFSFRVAFQKFVCPQKQASGIWKKINIFFAVFRYELLEFEAKVQP